MPPTRTQDRNQGRGPSSAKRSCNQDGWIICDERRETLTHKAECRVDECCSRDAASNNCFGPQ
jgi:hypothetical protein